MAAQRSLDLARGERRDVRLELDVPFEAAPEVLVPGQALSERGIARARNAPGLQQAALGGLDFGIVEAVLERAREFFADRGLDACAVLRREDRRYTEVRDLVAPPPPEP